MTTNRQLAVAVGQGDSGGPVVTDSRDREALGIISSGNNDVSCGLFASARRQIPPKRCFSTLRYATTGHTMQLQCPAAAADLMASLTALNPEDRAPSRVGPGP